jgi:dihydropteroate synthase
MRGDTPPAHLPPLRARDRTLTLGRRTYVMAILNLTDDSFSGDGVGGDLDAAVRRAVAAAADGADIVDVGAESARADAPPRDPSEEASLVAACVTRIAREVDAVISVDTYKPAVAEAALDAGAHMVNDIGGLLHDDGAARAAARYGAALVINYTVERPKVRPAAPPVYDDLIAAHLSFFRERIAVAAAAGVPHDCVVLDPGIAFGKSHDEDIEVLRRLGELRPLGRPLLVAASRKHFLGSITGLPPAERDEATAAVTALAIAQGADIVRVHDVRTNVRVARVADAIVRGRAGDYAATPQSWPWAAGATPIAGTRIGDLPRAGDPP